MFVARQIMTSQPKTVSTATTLDEVMRLLIDLGCSGVPVVHQGQLVGVISELALFDVLFDPSLKADCVGNHMTTTLYTVDEEDSLAHVAHMFALYGVRRLPVLADDRLVGIISRRDLLKFALQNEVGLADWIDDFIRHEEPDNDGLDVERLLCDVHPTS